MSCFKTGFSPLGLYACVFAESTARTLEGLLGLHYAVTAAPCAHTICRRHAGWRVDTSAPLESLRDFLLDAELVLEVCDEQILRRV